MPLLALHVLLPALVLGADPSTRVDRNFVPPAPPPVVIKTYKTYETPAPSSGGSGSRSTWKSPGSNAPSAREERDVPEEEERLPDKFREDEEKCRRSDANACFDAGFSAAVNPEKVWRARDLYARSCKLGLARGCLALGRSFRNPQHGRPDDAQAATAFRRACEGGEGAGCLPLSECYRSGSCGLAANQAEATRLLKAGCCLGDKQSCEADGSPAKPTSKQQACDAIGNPSKTAVPDWIKTKITNCTAGDLIACDLGGHLLANTAAPWRSPKEAVPLLTKACDGNSGGACGNLAAVYYAGAPGVPADHPMALRAAEKACAGWDKRGCNVLAKLLLKGKGVPQDARRAQELLAKAEANGDAAALETLGDLYAEGLGGVPVDRARARSYYKRACTAGHEPACPKQ